MTDQSEGSFTSQQRRTKLPSTCTNELQNVCYSLEPYPPAPCEALEIFCAPLEQAREDSLRRYGKRARIYVGSLQTLSAQLHPYVFCGFLNVPSAYNNGAQRFCHSLLTAHQ